MKLYRGLMVAVLSIASLTGCATTQKAVDEATSTGAASTTSVDGKVEADSKTEVEKQDKETTQGHLGEEIEVKNVVSVTVAATQVLDKLEVDLVGIPTTKFSLPTRYEGVTPVGQAMNPDFEIVASLDPDLVIIDKNFQEDVEASLKEYGIDAYYFNTGTYSSFLESIEELGNILQIEERADALLEELKEAEKLVADMKTQDLTLKVAVLFGGGENFMLATDQSYLGDLVQTVGADNITDDLKIESAYIPFSMEQLVAANPDYILRFAHGNIEETKKAFDKAFDKNPAFHTLDAVKEERVIDLDPRSFGVSANINVANAIKELGTIFYGE